MARCDECPACEEKTEGGKVCSRCSSLCLQCLANARSNLAGGHRLGAAKCRDYCLNGHRLRGQYDASPRIEP
jgi:hypothetical protein